MQSLLLLLLLLPLASSHVCVHDAHVKHLEPAVQAPPSDGAQARRSAASDMSPIRIQAIYAASNGGSDIATEAGMSSALKTVVATAVSAALARFSQLLLVRPVSGSLFAYRPCTSQWTNGRCAAVTTAPVCWGSADDVRISLSALLGSQVYYPTSSSSARTLPAAGSGISSADTAIFVTAKQTADCGTTGSGTIAYASYCQRASDDRPTFGRINLCPGMIPPSVTDAGYEDFLSTMMHELTHVLVFSSSLFPYFRDDAGVARTPRDSWGDPTTAFYSFPRNAYVASGSTISYASERGMACSWGAATSWAAANIPYGLDSSLEPSNCVARLSMPRVKAAARAFFSCDTLEGAELENQDTSSGFVQGSHWEARTLAGEYMAAYSSPGSKISAITLAVFEDSGWYAAAYANGDAWVAGRDWGYKQGCAFARDKCSSTNTGSPPHFYFASPDASGSLCSVDRSTPAYTATETYTSPLPAHYQYFSSPSKGGSAERYDYCPAIRPYTAPSTVCKTTTASVAYGETVGAGSKCHVSTLNRYSASPSSGYGSCYRITCAGSGLSYTLTVGTGATATCSTEGAVVTFTGYSGTVVCGSPAALCSAGEVWTPPVSPTPTTSPSPTRTPSGTPSKSTTPSRTGSASRTPSVSPTNSRTPSITPTRSESPSQTPSNSATPSLTPSNSASPSMTPSNPATPSPTPSLADPPATQAASLLLQGLPSSAVEGRQLTAAASTAVRAALQGAVAAACPACTLSVTGARDADSGLELLLLPAGSGRALAAPSLSLLVAFTVTSPVSAAAALSTALASPTFTSAVSANLATGGYAGVTVTQPALSAAGAGAPSSSLPLIIGVAVGALVLLAAAVLAFLCWQRSRRLRQRRAEGAADPAQQLPPTYYQQQQQFAQQFGQPPLQYGQPPLQYGAYQYEQPPQPHQLRILYPHSRVADMADPTAPQASTAQFQAPQGTPSAVQGFSV